MKTTDDQPKTPYLVPAVDKAVRIMDLLKSAGYEMTIAEIALHTGCHKSSVQKILVTLNHHGIVQRDEMTKRYSLGIALAEYGRVALNNLDLRHTAKPLLNELCKYSGETAVLAVLQGTKMVMVDKKEPLIQIRVSPFIGLRFPATTTSNGKVLLAWLPESRVNEILEIEGLPARTNKSITDAVSYRADLDATRERGYALECDEFQEGISGVSAPVFNARKQVIATLSVAGPTFRMTEDKIQDYGRKCIEVASQLSAKLR